MHSSYSLPDRSPTGAHITLEGASSHAEVFTYSQTELDRLRELHAAVETARIQWDRAALIAKERRATYMRAAEAHGTYAAFLAGVRS